MHKVRSFARSKAHAHGYNPWSSDADQLTSSPTEAVNLSQIRSNSVGRHGSIPRSSDPSNLRHAISTPERGRTAISPNHRRRSSGTDAAGPKASSVANKNNAASTAHPDRTVHFNARDSRGNNTENTGEPPDNPATQKEKKPGIVTRFVATCKQILFSSWINVLLVFVPVGIAVDAAGVDKTIVFVMNAIAIVPLASLLSYATESVAHRLGDTIGALMNVTFGNAVELIIFIIALTKNEISIVQASLVGSILANLLLILGMCFLLGGLRFREQIYNSTVTQMSACLLSISALSLLLPTAFHASFNNPALADNATLKVSRGTSVILLLIYILYLLFQLRSHAYLYASVPQHVIDEESHPGILAHLGSSSSSSSSSNSSRRSSVSSESSGGFARSIRDRLRRLSHHDGEGQSSTRSSATSHPSSPMDERRGRPMFQEKASRPDLPIDRHDESAIVETDDPLPDLTGPSTSAELDEKKVGLEDGSAGTEKDKTKKILRNLPGRLFSFQPKPASGSPIPISIPIAPGLQTQQTDGPHLVGRPAARRAASLPPRLTTHVTTQDMLPYIVPLNISEDSLDETKDKQTISRTSAIILLLCSTALVAICAEFMVDSINHLISTTNISEAFVGLILLPIVGNAAEHVTAVTVAAKNKMDLAIGVAVGSSIQIALFVTPLVVLLGWILDKDMGLYFNIFETVTLFTACFVVNFLVLDGRSNYLEGALLLASYVIISVAAFFYPNEENRSAIGTGSNYNDTADAVEGAAKMVKMLLF